MSLNKKNNDDLILLVCSDCSAVLNYFKKYYPLVLSTEKKYLKNGLGALHIKRNDLGNSALNLLAEEALVDMYLLSKSHFFLGSGGFFSRYISLLRNGKNVKSFPGNRTYNNSKFNNKFFPASNDETLSGYLTEYGFPLDGLFIHLEGVIKNVFYYDSFVGVFHGTKITSAEGLKIRQSIVDFRLY